MSVISYVVKSLCLCHEVCVCEGERDKICGVYSPRAMVCLCIKKSCSVRRILNHKLVSLEMKYIINISYRYGKDLLTMV